jgi:hypothetical protein
MEKANGATEASATSVPDLQDMWVHWQDASSQWGERSTVLARQCVGAGLHWMVQGAESTRQWAHALDSTARHWSDMARTAEHKLRTIDDIAALWNLELDIAGHGAETGADWGQQVWADQMRALSALAQDGALQGSRLMQAWTETGHMAAPRADAGDDGASSPPAAAWGLPALASASDVLKTMAQASQAFWSTAVAQTAAAMQPAPQRQGGDDGDTARPPRRASRRRKRATS